jgi:L-ascorbate metabolism protein UlaG (beta-lactamase superfamily)
MKITKIGHSCILIEENKTKILTDPGNLSAGQNELKDIDLILITHEHKDHLDLYSLKKILQNNPQAKIITNQGVGKVLEKEKISFLIVEDSQKIVEKGVLIEGFGKKHAIIHSSIPQIENTGYFIANKLFFPGDELLYPNKPVEILAAPITAPWTSVNDSLDYVIKVNPKIAFSIHEGVTILKHIAYTLPSKILESKGIKFIGLEDGKSFKN